MMVEEGLLRRAGEAWVAAGDLSNGSDAPTTDALLAARLESLAADEHEVIGAASVVGQLFVQDAVEELVSERVRQDVPELLEPALVGKRLIRPEQADPRAAEVPLRAHPDPRAPTHRGLLKQLARTLHERFVAWADRPCQPGS